MQFAEGLSDRDAAEAVRARIDWKYLLGLDLTDPGFDYSILSRFRDRLIEGNAEMLLLMQILEKSQKLGLIRRRGDMRTDATHAPYTSMLIGKCSPDAHGAGNYQPTIRNSNKKRKAGVNSLDLCMPVRPLCQMQSKHDCNGAESKQDCRSLGRLIGCCRWYPNFTIHWMSRGVDVVLATSG